jgi:hypothetical protein
MGKADKALQRNHRLFGKSCYLTLSPGRGGCPRCGTDGSPWGAV